MTRQFALSDPRPTITINIVVPNNNGHDFKANGSTLALPNQSAAATDTCAGTHPSAPGGQPEKTSHSENSHEAGDSKAVNGEPQVERPAVPKDAGARPLVGISSDGSIYVKWCQSPAGEQRMAAVD